MNINTIEIDGKEYTLTLNRKAVQVAEGFGLNPETFEKRPLTSISLIWRAGFLTKHPEVNDAKAEELYDKLEESNPDLLGEIIKSLVEQYSAFFKALSNMK